MAHVQPARPQAPLSKKFANFTNSTAGLDLTLRLIHALSIISAEVFLDSTIVVGCVTAASQLALGGLIPTSIYTGQLLGIKLTKYRQEISPLI
jgi:hypothetical protein